VLLPALPGPQQARDRLPAAAPAVVDEGHQRVVSERLLPGRGGVLLLGVGQHEHPVDVHDHLSAGVRSRLSGQLPDVFPDVGPRGADRRQGLRPGRGEGIDEAGDGGIGGHWTEHGRLGPQHAHVGQTVSAERDRQDYIQQDLPRIVHRPRLAPRCQSRRYRLWQTGLAGRLHQQDASRLRDHRPATTLEADTRVGPDTLLHL
jgi:hypothetical protein